MWIQAAFLIKWNRTGPGPSEKADPRSTEKPIPKFTASVKNPFFDKFESDDFKDYDRFLKFQPKNKVFFVPNLDILQSEILQLGKFGGADFKYDNSTFKFQPKISK